MERGFVRKLPALIVVAGLLATLTACSTSAAPGSAGCTTPASGDASSVVTASGAFGSEPTVKFPTPVNTKRTQVSVVRQGHGRVLTDGTPALVKFSIYSGTTGKKVSSSSYSKPTTPITAGATGGGPLVTALECARVGSRISVALKASELNASSAGTPVKPNDKSGPAYIAVIDVVKAFLPKADGAPVRGVNDMPAVVTAANGAPGISIPDIDAPTTEKIQLVRKGSGARLTPQDTAVVQFTAVDWASSPTVQGSTWTSGGAAATVPLSSKPLPDSQQNAPESITKALVGQTVGSQVMAVVPSKTSTGAPTSFVYVFDILGAL